MLKRLTTISIIVCLALSLVACGGSGTNNTSDTQNIDQDGPVLLDFSGLEEGASGIGVGLGMTPDEVAVLFPEAGAFEDSESGGNGRMNMGYVIAYGHVWRAHFFFNSNKGLREIILFLLTEEDAEKVADYQGFEEKFFSAGDSGNVAGSAATAIIDRYIHLPYEYKYLDTSLFTWTMDDNTRVGVRIFFSDSAQNQNQGDLKGMSDVEDVQINFILDR